MALAIKIARIGGPVMPGIEPLIQKTRLDSSHNVADTIDGDPIRELHQDQGSYAPYRQARLITAPAHRAEATTQNPCTRGPATYASEQNLAVERGHLGQQRR